MPHDLESPEASSLSFSISSCRQRRYTSVVSILCYATINWKHNQFAGASRSVPTINTGITEGLTAPQSVLRRSRPGQQTVHNKRLICLTSRPSLPLSIPQQSLSNFLSPNYRNHTEQHEKHMREYEKHAVYCTHTSIIMNHIQLNLSILINI